MELFRRAVGNYWVAYYLFYVAIASCGWWANRERIYWRELLLADDVYLLAAILGVAAGIALFAAIILEVTGRMVLLIPKAWNRAKREGRAEQRKLTDEAYKRFGVEVDGVLALPRTPEVERFLAGETEERF